MRLGFVGTGVIADAIVRGLLAAHLPITSIVVSPRNAQTAVGLAGLSPLVRLGRDNQDVVDSADWVFLAIRPQICQEVVRSLHFRPDQKVVSLVATVRHESLNEWIPGARSITRAVPLPAVADRQGVTAIYPHDAQLKGLFACLGTVIECEDRRQFDLITTASAVMGTYFGILNICQEWLVEMGLQDGDATAYLKALVQGLSEDMKGSGLESFEGLRLGHSTPGGLNDQMYQIFALTGGVSSLRTGLNSVLERVERAA